MGPILIKTLSECDSDAQNAWIRSARKIFIETRGRTEFSSPEEEQAFEWRYFGIYASSPGFFHLALQNDRILGYLAGAPQTLPIHFELNPYLRAFEKEILGRFPAHLHMNLASSARGSGTGTLLMERFAKQMRQISSRGIHIVTAVGERNVAFYAKNRFQEVMRSSRGSATLLLMGRAPP
jgi:GNAT superfamily N-acetyltransferase